LIAGGECPQKRTPHPFRIGKSRLARNHPNGMTSLLDHQTHRLDTQVLHRLGGDCPVSARNARLNWRGLSCAASARTSTDKSFSRFFFT
jgi:hypothetical protein